MSKAKPKPRRPVTADEFVQAWRDAKSLADVCKATGMDKGSAGTRAVRLRRRGVPLKKFPTGRPRLDVKQLIRLATA